MARGNQRELSRKRAAKKAEVNGKKTHNKDAKKDRDEKGVSFANDRERQAQIMREKQQAAEARKK